MNIAILDFDDTLYTGISRYDLGFAMSDAGVIGKDFKKELSELLDKYESGEIDYNTKFAQDKAIFSKYYKDMTRLQASQFLENEFEISKNIKEWAKPLIASLKEKGYLTVVISGAWDFILENAQEELNFDTFFGSEFELDSGKITGEYVQIGDHEFKRTVAARLLQDADDSVGLGDSTADVEFLNIVKHAFIYRPTDEARAVVEGLDIIEVEDSNVVELVMDSLK